MLKSHVVLWLLVLLTCVVTLAGCGQGDRGSHAGQPAVALPAAGSPVAPPVAVGGTTGAPEVAGTGAPQAGSAGGAAGAPVAGAAPSAGGGGAAGAAGSGTAGTAAAAGSGAAGSPAAGSGAAGAPGGVDSACKAWPEATGERPVAATIRVSGVFDGELQRYTGAGSLGGDDQSEGQGALFELAPGALLKNVILGAPAADGVHCNGACELQNVWWEDVGEDAATLLGSGASQRMTVACGGARKANDKVFQHNGPGTIEIRNFYAEDIGKLYRSCGNCGSQFKRAVLVSGVDIAKAKVIAGINTNYGDSARFENVTLHDSSPPTSICDRYTGNDSGDEPKKTGSGADAMHCIYAESDIHRVP